MMTFKKSLLAQAFAVSLLGLGVTACNSPEQETDVVEEPVESTTFETENEVEPGTMSEETDAIESDVDTNVVEGDIAEEHAVDHDHADAHAAEGMENDMDMVDENQLGTADNDEVLDGTEQEEHVSTY